MAATRRPGGGRKPVPTHLKLLHGNPGRRPLPADEPMPASKIPVCPAELSDGAKRIWRRDAKKLHAVGIMTELDGAAFAAYCASYARWLEANALLAKSGPLIKDGAGGVKLNPLLRVVRDAQEQYTRALAEFGMSPSSRTRVKGTPQEAVDPFEDFMSGSGSGGNARSS